MSRAWLLFSAHPRECGDLELQSSALEILDPRIRGDERERNLSQRGLTLVETLVAMAILAAVAVSAYALLSQGANFAASERDRLAASIVADNLMVEELLKEAAPDLGEDTGEVEFAGRVFEWSSIVTDSGEDLRRIELKVRLQGFEQTLARVETVKVAS